jgi:GT2 family glycosyltransferase
MIENKEIRIDLDREIKNTISDDDMFTVQKDDSIDLSIIVPVFNNVNFTKLALDGLTKLSNRYEILIIDNKSTDETSKVVDEFAVNTSDKNASVLHVKCSVNMGFSASNNKGYKYARGRNIMFLNNDIRIKDNFETWPEEMIKLAEEGYIVGTQGGLMDGHFNFVTEGTNLPQTNYWYISGWCMCGSRKTFDKLILNYYRNSEDQIVEGKAWGPWNERFFLYFEDGDLTWRAKKLGIEFKEVEVPIHHFSRMTGRKYSMFGYYKKSQRIFKKEWIEKYKP